MQLYKYIHTHTYKYQSHTFSTTITQCHTSSWRKWLTAMAHSLQSRNCASNGLKATAGGAHIKAKTRVHPNSSFQPSLFFSRLKKKKTTSSYQTAFHSEKVNFCLFRNFMSIVNHQTNQISIYLVSSLLRFVRFFCIKRWRLFERWLWNV